MSFISYRDYRPRPVLAIPLAMKVHNIATNQLGCPWLSRLTPRSRWKTIPFKVKMHKGKRSLSGTPRVIFAKTSCSVGFPHNSPSLASPLSWPFATPKQERIPIHERSISTAVRSFQDSILSRPPHCITPPSLASCRPKC